MIVVNQGRYAAEIDRDNGECRAAGAGRRLGARGGRPRAYGAGRRGDGRAGGSPAAAGDVRVVS